MKKFPPVKIYSTSWCVYCKVAKDFLKENKVPFEEVDIEANEKAAEEMIKKTGQIRVPVIEIGGKIFVAFNRAAIKKELGLK